MKYEENTNRVKSEIGKERFVNALIEISRYFATGGLSLKAFREDWWDKLSEILSPDASRVYDALAEDISKELELAGGWKSPNGQTARPPICQYEGCVEPATKLVNDVSFCEECSQMPLTDLVEHYKGRK
jgi:hypothetical protein